MTQSQNIIKTFFETYEKATNSLDIDAFSSLYADTFTFGGKNGIQVVQKENFLSMLPKRKGFFEMVGLTKTSIVSIESDELDAKYTVSKVKWNMLYEKAGKDPINNESAATYILFCKDNNLQIVMQIDHQDLMERVKELGLL